MLCPKSKLVQQTATKLELLARREKKKKMTTWFHYGVFTAQCMHLIIDFKQGRCGSFSSGVAGSP